MLGKGRQLAEKVDNLISTINWKTVALFQIHILGPPLPGCGLMQNTHFSERVSFPYINGENDESASKACCKEWLR